MDIYVKPLSKTTLLISFAGHTVDTREAKKISKLEIWTDKNNYGIEGEEFSAQEIGDLLEGDVLMAGASKWITIYGRSIPDFWKIFQIPGIWNRPLLNNSFLIPFSFNSFCLIFS